jgi:iron complex outermembrane receptor protein
MVGVSVILNNKSGITTDVNGSFTLKIKPGTDTLLFKFIGYSNEKKIVEAKAGDIISLDIEMMDESRELDEVVVSAGKFEQRLSDVTMSMQVIKSALIENNNTTTIETAIQQTPGVMIMDGQASIRGGSGYSYGAGSRVLLCVDDLPMLSGSAGDAKWDFAPVENIEQIEVIKGASSALYGSSALNGIINIRTAYPGNVPQTKVIVFDGIYNNPIRKEIIWWGNTQPMFTGAEFSHLHKIGNFDLMIGGNAFFDQGYRLNNDNQRFRVNVNTRYRDKKVKGLSYGINANVMNVKGAEFLLWQDGDSGVYRPSSSYTQEFNNSRVNIDPFITYFNPNGNRHSLKTRFFRTENKNNTQQNNYDNLYFAEYQFQKHFKKELVWTIGLTGNYCESVSDIFGNKPHYSSSTGLFSQIDKKYKKLSFSGGARWEGYKLDETSSISAPLLESIGKAFQTMFDFFKDKNSKPVFRAGLSYELNKKTFLRASFGQGFRFPTIAEKYTESHVGALNLFPNPNLLPERGWSAEIGAKRGFKVSGWNGMIDIAGFWTEYHNMIEFAFGVYNPDSIPISIISTSPGYFGKWVGFQASNISNAQITGVDITITGHGKLFGWPATLLAGYTYTNPIDLNVTQDSNYVKNSTQSQILKYRFYHSAKADLEVTHLRFSAGFSLDYHSVIINIDKAFEDTIRYPGGSTGIPMVSSNGVPMMILPGIKDYRAKHNKGDIVCNARISYQVTEESKLAIVIKNVFNREYMDRPADVQPPRSIALQYSLKL